jgi:hypothetical protein
LIIFHFLDRDSRRRACRRSRRQCNDRRCCRRRHCRCRRLWR